MYPVYLRLNTTFLLSEYQWSAYGDDLPQERRFRRVRAIAADVIVQRVAARAVVAATDGSRRLAAPLAMAVIIVLLLLESRGHGQGCEGSARRRLLLLMSRVKVRVVVVVVILREWLLLLVEVVYRYRWGRGRCRHPCRI